MNQLSDRLNRLSPSATLAMSQKSNELKAQGVDVINLSVGTVRFCQPAAERSGAHHALRISQGYRPQQQDDLPAADHHAVCYLTALVQRFLAMVKAISAAASTAIPADETTWGAVFIEMCIRDRDSRPLRWRAADRARSRSQGRLRYTAWWPADVR